MVLPKIFSNSIIYTSVTILQKCIYFFLLPLYTLYLTPADYGITGIVASFSSLLSIFIVLGLDTAASRFYYKYKSDTDYIKRLYGTIALVILINSIVFGGVFILFHDWVIDPFLGGIEYYPFVFVGLLNVIVSPLYILFQGYLQTIQDGKTFGINAMLNFFIHVGLTIIFVVYLELGALGVLLASLITSIVFFLYTIIVFIRYQVIVIDRRIVKESLKYSLPILPHTLANWSNSTIDKLLVNGIRTEVDAGLYNLGNQYASVATVLTVSVNNAYLPWFFEKVNDLKSNLSTIRKMSEILTWIVSFVCICMSLLSKEVLDLMINNPAYDDVWKVVPFIICGVIFGFIYFFYVNILFLKDTKLVFIITLLSVIINVILNLWLIPILGYIGCGISFLGTFLMKSIIAVFVSMWMNKEIRFRTMYLFFIGILSSLISISALLFECSDVWVSVVLKLIVILLYISLIFLIYRSDFNSIFQHFIKKTGVRL